MILQHLWNVLDDAVREWSGIIYNIITRTAISFEIRSNTLVLFKYV